MTMLGMEYGRGLFSDPAPDTPFCRGLAILILAVSLSSSEPLKRVAASSSSSINLAATRGWCHTTLEIIFSSSDISNGSITVVKVPLVCSMPSIRDSKFH